MKLLCYSFDDPRENLALDEALLEEAESEPQPTEILRCWKQSTYCVVLGRSSQRALEVNLPATQRDQVPVLRRASGGASVLIGPGCFLFTLVLSLVKRPELRMVDVAHQWIMAKIQSTVAQFEPRVRVDGICDLTLGNRKISGNALRLKRRALLYHGTLLHQFDLSKLQEYLLTPPKQPEYRHGRDHGDFVTNLPIDSERFQSRLAVDWGATSPYPTLPVAKMRQLMAVRYGNAAWHEEK